MDQLDFEEAASSDDDYSPGSLVIDTEGGESTSPHLSPIDIPHSSPLPPTDSGSEYTLPMPLMSLALPPPTIPPMELLPHPLSNSMPPQQYPLTSSQPHSHIPSQPHTLTPSQPSSGEEMVVTLGHQVLVVKEGSAPVDTLCVYYYHWGSIVLDVLVTNSLPSYIPVKNVYQRAIPSLKQNVLSARISKHGIRSAVLSEPYVSTVKKLGLGLTGSSHYITIPDFFKICRYFKHTPPEKLSSFQFVTSAVSTDDVLVMFNQPESDRGRELLVRLCTSESSDGRGMANETSSPALYPRVEGEMSHDYGGVSEIDARTLTIPGGKIIILIIREGVPYIPNPELAKILPNVTRTAMEVIRNTYGIIVEQSSKPEINLMKLLGVVSPKAGRTLLYRVSDVAKMYPHWKMIIPDFVEELCAGKIPETKVDTSQSLPPVGFSPSSATRRKRKNGRAKVRKSDPLWTGKVEREGVYGTSTEDPVWMTKAEAFPHPSTTLTTPTPSHFTTHTPSHLATPTPSHLTPDWFQQPVKLLNSIEQALKHPSSEYPSMTSSHMTEPSSHMTSVTGSSSYMTNAGGHMTADFVTPKPPPKRRRTSSASGPPLDDSGLEYASMVWGDHTLTLLCPHSNQPYLPIPDFMQRILNERPYLNPQLRTQMGVVPLPATSLQVHTLRAHGSSSNFTGKLKLLSLSDAVRLAAITGVTIPGSVINTLRSFSHFLHQPIEDLLAPQPTHNSQPPHASQPTHASQGVEPTQEVIQEATLPSHPDVIDLGRNYNLGVGLLCQVKWAEMKLVVYVMAPGVFYMGLYQVYEELFKVYVTRVNFKMRMRKLHVRSIRAASIVRVKLIELGALPPHCPVCGLILVSQMEKLARSYGVIPPNVVYEAFISQEVEVVPPIPQAKGGRPRKVPIHHKATPTTSTASSNQKEHNVFMYQFNDTPNNSQPPSISLVSRTPPVVSSSHLIGQLDTDKLISPVYGMVPYLTSSWESIGESPNPKHLTMTSSPPVSIKNLIPTTTSESELESLIVSIPRSLTQFSYSHSNVVSSASSSKASLGGPRRKVLQSLAKKIAQKSRKYTTNSQISSLPQKNSVSFNEVNMPERMCTSCRRSNPMDKRKCVYCGSGLGRICPICGMLCPTSATSCAQCHANLTYTWTVTSGHTLTSTSLVTTPTTSSNEGMVSPSSPTSPKFSAPPIRSAVLKNLFPQDSRRSEGVDPALVANGGGGQLLTKTTFIGNMASSRKCYECGQLNSKMAKKCIGCRSHLQGRACLRCGRPNLSIVSQCHKCGAPLPNSATPSHAYKGSRGGREYKTSQQSHEEKILKSTAPISCISCHKIRLRNYFKCGRCGDVFKSRPLVDKTPPETTKSTEGEELGESSNQKKGTMSHDTLGINTITPTSNDLSDFSDFGRNIVTLDLADTLAPLFIQREEECKEQLPQVEEEMEVVENEYQAFLYKKQLLQNSYDDEQAEVNGLIREVENYTSLLDNVLAAEREAQEMLETVPQQINELETKLSKIGDTVKLFAEVREL